MLDLTNDQRGWVLTLASSLASILGSFTICLDLAWARLFPHKPRLDLQNNKSFLIASLSLSSGILLFTSMYRLLPEALEYFEDSPAVKTDRMANALLLGIYILGIIISSLINLIIHVFTSQSIVHCAHEGEEENDHEHHTHHHHHHAMTDHGDESNAETHEHLLVSESSPLLKSPRVKRRMSIIDLTTSRLGGKRCIGRCMGYSSVEDCFKDTGASLTSEDEDLEGAGSDVEQQHHHHHVSTQYSHMFSIGLQTALAISVHKIPEGFITFATSHASPRLGFAVFSGLAVHNFAEGFTIAFPLYLALRSRFASILTAVVLGGFSQPIGAFFAWLYFRNKATNEYNLLFGVLMATTAGLLSIIGLQMYGASVAFGGKQSNTLMFAFLGITIIGLSSLVAE
ncbi:zinc-regulated transporter 3 [Trichomonascus vanleenenianus]|uniref:Zn(2+) transporter ZRT3 n=1 Tax=Trichomonascus vanleenenianus TaxID=2268995 RepID=UPI003ECAFE8F